MYIRFAVTEIDEDTCYSKGLFSAAFELRRSYALPTALHKHLRTVLRWFNDELPAPRSDSLDQRAIFWFRSDAGVFIDKAWELAGLLQVGGYVLNYVTCDRPGRVVYRDEHQVGAVPFREMRRRL